MSYWFLWLVFQYLQFASTPYIIRVCVCLWNWIGVPRLDSRYIFLLLFFSYILNGIIIIDLYFQLEFQEKCNWNRTRFDEMMMLLLFHSAISSAVSYIQMRNWESRFDTLMIFEYFIWKFSYKGVLHCKQKLWFIYTIYLFCCCGCCCCLSFEFEHKMSSILPKKIHLK